MKDRILKMRDEMLSELTENILPFWMKNMNDHANGGFTGRIDGNGRPVAGAVKGAILNARILWTFSAAYRILGKSEYLETASRAKDELIGKFYDKEHGGVFWSLDAHGRPCDMKKQIYAIGFAIYGLSEYYRAAKDEQALKYAVKLMQDIERHSFDPDFGGYFEAFDREWNELEDMRLSEKDFNDCKTMNTHLHIIEPYTNLLRVWRTPELEERVRHLLNVFTDRIIDPRTHHLRLFFGRDWHSTHNIISYGHDIEASWLLNEAADVLADPRVVSSIAPVVASVADAAAEGFIPHTGMIYESSPDTGAIDADRHWWVQAESVVGFFNLWQRTGNADALEKAFDCWDFIKKHIIDKTCGEWYWSLRADGTPNKDEDKAGFWKCPYHNGRMCMEIIERFVYRSKKGPSSE